MNYNNFEPSMNHNDIEPRIRHNTEQRFDTLNAKHVQVQDKANKLFPVYDTAARALEMILEYNQPKDSIKLLRGSDPQISMARGLTKLALVRREEIDYLLQKIQFQNSHDFNVWQLRILIAELLWGKQKLKSSAPTVMFIREYEQDLRETFVEVSTLLRNSVDRDKSLFPTYVRLNTLSISIETGLNAFSKEGWKLLPRCETYMDHLKVVKNLEGKNFIRDFHIYELFVFPPGTSFYEHPGYLNGKFVIQDKGSCLSSFLLNPKPGSVVLDMCAAVGFKTNHLANIMNNNGLIYANDQNERRLEKMNAFMDLTDVKCVEISNGPHFHFKKFKDVEYILLDPDSTYSGLFLAANENRIENRITDYAALQYDMLKYALQKFPNVKRIVYTICSTFSEEGEHNINQILKDVGYSYNLLNVRKMLWKEWYSVSNADLPCSDRCLRIKPVIDLCQGYFIAVFERNYDVPVPACLPSTTNEVENTPQPIKSKNEKKNTLQQMRPTSSHDSNETERADQRYIPKMSEKFSTKRPLNKSSYQRTREMIKHEKFIKKKMEEVQKLKWENKKWHTLQEFQEMLSNNVSRK